MILTIPNDSTIKIEAKRLKDLSEEWLIRKIAACEDEKQKIADIFERFNDARHRFQVRLTSSLRLEV